VIDYDPHNWARHFFDIKGSMVREIIGRAMGSTLFAVLATLLWNYKEIGGIPDKGHALIGVSLGLLLVFRTNASYDRFWEGRKQWGAIVNETRNLGRQAAIYMAKDPELAKTLVRWTIAFPWATMGNLRGTKGLGDPKNLPPEETAEVLAANHLPLAIATKISRIIQTGRERGLYPDYVQMQLDQNSQLLVDYMGACERIHKTPLPFAYVVHLRRMLVVYCLTLPFALIQTFGWVTIPVTFLVAYSLFGIEEIGVEIEDPFGFDDNDLPLERICTTIERDLRAIMDRHLGGDK
jgi:ion channel-forming bestrophin family protein